MCCVNFKHTVFLLFIDSVLLFLETIKTEFPFMLPGYREKSSVFFSGLVKCKKYTNISTKCKTKCDSIEIFNAFSRVNIMAFYFDRSN